VTGKRCSRLPLLGILFFTSLAATASDRPRIAIIIDDIGNDQRRGERAIALDGPLAYAVLPGTPRAAALAELAHARGREVLLHLPLQAEVDPVTMHGDSLVLDMSRAQFRQVVVTSLAAIPHVSGVNTHRGSLLTRHPGHMGWLMEDLQSYGGLYFVDSYTTARSVALDIAREQGVPSVKRDVFLDPDREPATVHREFQRLKSLARTQGYAVAIGHPYPATLEYLERALASLAAEGFDLVPVGLLIAQVDKTGRHPGAAAAE